MTKESIGRYEIEAEIGQGGMAVVYLAYDPRFKRKVAIKLVAVKLQENITFRERFEREAQLIARIEHPAIVPVYDFGEQDDQPYLVMRYMPGGSLSSKIKQGPLTLEYASQIISQLAPALDAVHAQGIVHRDLKPANILLDGFGNPAISDFGIAYFTQATSDLTGSAIIGTPAYMSPEQIRGDEDIDGRSDIYALGIILFEMLSGSGPFRAATPLSVAMKHLSESVPSMRSFRPDLPAEIDDVLNKTLAKQRDLRFSTASDLARELQIAAAHGKAQPLAAPVRTAEDAPTELLDIEDGQPDRSRSDVEPNIAPSAMLHKTADVPSGTLRKTPSWPSRNIIQILVIAVLGVFLFFLCGSIGVFGTWAGLSGFFQAQSPTSLPTLTSVPTENIQETVLFADDFADVNSGWPSGQNSRGEYAYQSAGYHILVNTQDEVLWVSTDRIYSNLSVLVDTRLVSGNANGYHGLLCRIQDDQNFYYFVIKPNGEFTLGKYKDAEFQSFLVEGWKRSSAIQQGDRNNRLKAECNGNTLRFYANDVLLAEATDSDFTSGFSGMVAASLEDKGYEVLFDNFLITQPGQ